MEKKGQLAIKVKEIYIKKEKPDICIMVKVTYNLKTQSFASQNLIMCVGAPEAKRRHQISYI